MAAITGARVKGIIEVAPGRKLSFAEFGRHDGRAVVWLHGTPGARTQVPEEARLIAAREGLRIIGIDRPGIGRSTAHVYRDVADFADDLRVVLDALVTAVGSLGGVAPTVGPDAAPGGIVDLARRTQPFLKFVRVPLGFGLSRFVQAVTPLGDPLIGLYARFSPPGDRALLSHEDFKSVFLGDLTRQGRRQFSAPFADIMLFGRDWGFRLDDVKVPVHWWHGDADNIIPFAHGAHMVDRLPDAHLHAIPGGGHLAGFGVSSEVLEAVLG